MLKEARGGETDLDAKAERRGDEDSAASYLFMDGDTGARYSGKTATDAGRALDALRGLELPLLLYPASSHVAARAGASVLSLLGGVGGVDENNHTLSAGQEW